PPGSVVVRVPRAVTIRGSVRDPAGRPIAGARVRIESVKTLGLDPRVRTLQFDSLGSESSPDTGAATDADGSFVLEALEGCGTISAEAEGFDPVEQVHACLAPGAEPSRVDMTMAGRERAV